MITYDFSEYNVLITGGTKGIGESISRLFVKSGANVYATYYSDEQSAEDLKTGLGENFNPIKSDASSEKDVEKLFDYLKNNDIPVNVLVNNAGIVKDNYLMMMKTEEWDSVIDTNLKSTFLNSRAALKAMIRKKWGRIINMVSPTAFLGVAGQTNYGASKGGIYSFTKSLSKEVARYKITVNCVSPGLIKTHMTEKLPDDIKKKLLSNVAQNKMGTPGDVANAVCFLASANASYITGQTLCVDGGLV